MAMTAQEIFTKVATHLLTQKQRARYVHSNGAESPCRYRTATGLSCAVGCLIPDDLYDPRIEGTILNGVIEMARGQALTEPLTAFLLNELDPHYRLLADLQWVHDQRAPDRWRQHLSETAQHHGLVMPDVQ